MRFMYVNIFNASQISIPFSAHFPTNRTNFDGIYSKISFQNIRKLSL